MKTLGFLILMMPTWYLILIILSFFAGMDLANKTYSKKEMKEIGEVLFMTSTMIVLFIIGYYFYNL